MSNKVKGKGEEPSRGIGGSEPGKKGSPGMARREAGVGKSEQKRANIDWVIENEEDMKAKEAERLAEETRLVAEAKEVERPDTVRLFFAEAICLFSST